MQMLLYSATSSKADDGRQAHQEASENLESRGDRYHDPLCHAAEWGTCSFFLPDRLGLLRDRSLVNLVKLKDFEKLSDLIWRCNLGTHCVLCQKWAAGSQLQSSKRKKSMKWWWELPPEQEIRWQRRQRSTRGRHARGRIVTGTPRHRQIA